MSQLFFAVACQLSVVTVHQQCIFRAGDRTLARHEVLGGDIAIKRGGIVADFDLKIARDVTGIEWSKKRNKCVDDCLTSIQLSEIEAKFLTGGSKIQNAVFSHC